MYTLSSPLASAQAVTSKWQLRTTSPNNCICFCSLRVMILTYQSLVPDECCWVFSSIIDLFGKVESDPQARDMLYCNTFTFPVCLVYKAGVFDCSSVASKHPEHQHLDPERQTS